MPSECIRVFGRVRPTAGLRQGDSRSAVTADADHSLIRLQNHDAFEFDGVFDENADQDSVFCTVALGIVDDFLLGINGTVFAYGQTGSGKTFTMVGAQTIEASSANRGIIPRVLERIFSVLDQRSGDDSSFNYTITCQFVEVYNERAYDLLSDAADVHVARNGDEVRLVDAAKPSIANMSEALDLFSAGMQTRRVASTTMNRESSRSHALFVLQLETKQVNEGGVRVRCTSQLNLVDLAGSERQSHTGATTSVRLKEAGNINNSLSVLARVMRTLAGRDKKAFVPYRDSILTYVLMNGLGGNSRTSVVINLHPDNQFASDTLSSLRFSQTVKKVRCRAVINQDIVATDISAYKERIVFLESRIATLEEERENSAATASTATNSDLESRLAAARKECAMLASKVAIKDRTIAYLRATSTDVNAKSEVLEAEMARLQHSAALDAIDGPVAQQLYADTLLDKSELESRLVALENRLRDRDQDMKRYENLQKSVKRVRDRPGQDFSDVSFDGMSPQMSYRERRARRTTVFTPRQPSPEPTISEEDETDDRDQRIADLEIELTAMHENVADLKKALADATEASDLAEIMAQMEELRTERDEFKEQAAELADTRKALQREREARSNVEKAHKVQCKTLDNYVTQVDRLAQEAAGKEQELNAWIERCEALESDRFQQQINQTMAVAGDDAERRLETVSAELEESRATNEALKAEVAKLNARIEQLKKLRHHRDSDVNAAKVAKLERELQTANRQLADRMEEVEVQTQEAQRWQLRAEDSHARYEQLVKDVSYIAKIVGRNDLVHGRPSIFAVRENQESVAQLVIKYISDTARDYEFQLSSLRLSNDTLRAEKGQLAELSKQNELLRKELAEAASRYGENAGHMNHRQKIQFVQKVTNELAEVKAENAKLKAKLEGEKSKRRALMQENRQPAH